MILFYQISLSLFVGTLCLAAVDLSALNKQLKDASDIITKNETSLKSLELETDKLVKKVQQDCGINLTSKNTSGPTCKPEVFTPLVKSYSQLKDAQTAVDTQLTNARNSYKNLLKDSKADLVPADYSALLNASDDLNSTTIKRMKIDARANALKAEINQAKAMIEQSEHYKLLSKALTNTLNSTLFCQARDRCDGKGGNIYEGDVTAKILSSSATATARSKVNKTAPSAPK